MQESPDRWLTRLIKAARPHGRFAVISSSATAGVLLLVGGIAFASLSNDSSNVSSPTKSAVSSRANADGSPTAGSSSTVTTTTVLGGSTESTTPQSGAQGTITTNTTTAGAPTTGGQQTTLTTLPSTTSPTTVAGITSTSTKLHAQNGPLVPSLLADATSSTDDPVLNLKISAGDKDGYVTRVVVNWNDETPWTVVDYPLSSCTEPLSSAVSPSATHTYTTAGSYTVTITVSSENCVGEGEQQSIITKQVSVGGSVATTTSPSTTTTTTP